MLGSVRKQVRQTLGPSDQLLQRCPHHFGRVLHRFASDLHFELVSAFSRRLDENIPKLERGLAKRPTAKTHSTNCYMFG